MLTCTDQCVFALREAPHRIEISEGEPFDATEIMPAQTGHAFEMAPFIMGEQDEIDSAPLGAEFIFDQAV